MALYFTILTLTRLDNYPVIIPHLAVKSKVLGVCGIAFEVSQGLLSDFTGTTFFAKYPYSLKISGKLYYKKRGIIAKPHL